MKKKEQISNIIADNIRAERNSRGISQEELADLCELHRTYIGAIERGERNITVNTLAKISDALELPIASLLKGGSK